MTVRSAHWRLALPALLLALIVAGCGGSDADREASGTAAATKPRPSATTNQINAMSRDKVHDGGTMTWPLDSMPVNFNYNQIDGTEATQAYVILAMMPVAYHTDATGTPYYNADIFASAPVLVTEPKQVVAYTINPKAVWSDGTPITWQDFYWQWRASNGTDKAYQISGSQGYEDIESVARGKDDREVVVTFKHRYADWQNIFNPFYPASTNKSPKLFNEGWKNGPLVTAGPFMMDKIDQTAKTVTLVRSKTWWGNPPKLDRLVFRSLDPDAHIDALANGEIDAMEIASDVNKFNRAKAVEGTEIRIAGGPNFSHLTLNASSANLRDVNVRRAIAKAIDRSAIARSLLGPLGLPTDLLNNHIFMRNQAGYQDNSGDVGKYDPMRAGQMLDEAGWTLQGGVRKKDGRTLELSVVIPTGVATSRQIAELLQNLLGQVGVKANINAVPSNDFFDKYVTPGQFDITLFSWIGTAFPISSTKSIYAKPTVGPTGELSIRQNYARLGSDEIDRLYDQANAELDRTKAIALANQLDALIWQEVHTLPVYQRPELWAVKKGLANFGAVGFADIIYPDIGWAK